jgi:hypothetical protein
MRSLFYILLFIPTIGIAQYDFETRYFKIDNTSLPQVVSVSSQAKEYTASLLLKTKSLYDFVKVTEKNYWQPVDMTRALAHEETGLIDPPQINYPKLDSKDFGFSVQVGNSNSRAGISTNGIKNTVYKEQRGRFFCDPTGNYAF